MKHIKLPVFESVNNCQRTTTDDNCQQDNFYDTFHIVAYAEISQKTLITQIETV